MTIESKDSQKTQEAYPDILKFKSSHLKIHDFGYILYRNLFLLTNGIIFSVVVLLYIFGDRRAALSLGLISILNISLGLMHDINAWLALEKLQLLTAPYVIRIKKDGTDESVLNENILKGDLIKLKIGDQIPCDGVVVNSQSLEINEGLITGESNLFAKDKDDKILAGSVVTAGLGIIRAETIYRESRISQMTEGIKEHKLNLSPIQKEVGLVAKYSGYALIIMIAFIIIRGILVNEPALRIAKNIGAISIIIVPAGLLFAITLLFAYGAARLLRIQVLLSEISATEKLGRIKNLCMDKTGTITENFLTVEKMYVPKGIDLTFAQKLIAAYIQGSNDSSQIISAVDKFIKVKYEGEIIGTLAFSSWRQYGAVSLKEGSEKITVLVGSSDIFLPHVKDKTEKQWLEALIETNSRQGKHILCIARLTRDSLNPPKNLTNIALSLIAVFVFQNNLREGIRDAIDFFQNRGVYIRIISGDNPETVRAIAEQAGIRQTDKSITGKEMELWDKSDFKNKAKMYFIFSRVMPAQKEKIIEALKGDGFTAMIGDGANDALAIKNADLGIAMFEGAPATRHLASVVLMNNSFSALPGGVKLADTIITNLEIFSSIFLNVSFVGFFFFIFISLLGIELPLTPMNIALINYFIIGIPGLLIFYWSIRPSGKIRDAKDQPFLKRIMPFTIYSAIFQAFGLAIIYWLSPTYLKAAQSNTLVLMGFIIVGFIFFIYALKHFQGEITRIQKLQISALALSEILLLFMVFNILPVAVFFDITGPYPALKYIFEIFLIAGLLIFSLNSIAKGFIFKKQPRP